MKLAEEISFMRTTKRFSCTMIFRVSDFQILWIHFFFVRLTLISTTGERISLFNRSSNLFVNASRDSQMTTDIISSNSIRKPSSTNSCNFGVNLRSIDRTSAPQTISSSYNISMQIMFGNIPCKTLLGWWNKSNV